MNYIKTDIEERINHLAKELVKLSLKINDNKIYLKAKSELADSSAFLMASYLSSRQQTTPLNVVVKLNQAIDYAGKCKFWLDFIVDEGIVQNTVSNQLNRLLNQVFEDLNLERTKKENEIPVFASEWLLDF
jgi:hypothetical protein